MPPSGLTSHYDHHHQAFESLLQLYEARADHEELCIPICMLPATISNNVPGTDLSIGADTSLNAIVEVRAQNRDGGGVRRRYLLEGIPHLFVDGG